MALSGPLTLIETNGKSPLNTPASQTGYTMEFALEVVTKYKLIYKLILYYCFILVQDFGYYVIRSKSCL